MEKRAGQTIHPMLAVILVLAACTPILIYLFFPAAPAKKSPFATDPGSPGNAASAGLAPDIDTHRNPVDLSTAVRLTPHTGTILDISNDPVLAALPVTRVSVDIDNLLLPDAVDKFATFFPAFTGPQGPYRGALAQDRLVNLHLKDAPLWEVLFQFSSQTALPYLEVSKDLINASGPDTRPIHWCVAGPFATVVQKVIGIRSLALPDSAPADIQLTLEAYAEPSLGNVILPDDAEFSDLTDENGRPILRAGPAVVVSTGAKIQQRVLTFPLKIPLETAPATTVKRIGRLKGTFPFFITTKTFTLQTAGPTEARTETINGMTVEINPFTSLANGPAPAARAPVRLLLKFSQGTMPPAQWAGIANAMRAARPLITTASQQTVMGPAYPSVRAGPTFDLSYILTPGQLGSDPHHFSIEIPIEWSEVRVPFDFTDIPLP